MDGELDDVPGFDVGVDDTEAMDVEVQVALVVEFFR